MEIVGWLVFAVLVIAVWVFDLGVFNRTKRVASVKGALVWTLVWVMLAVIFGSGIYYFYGAHQAVLFFTGYVVEESLSVDNLFVFLVVFRYFAVAEKFQHRVLFWGIIGALLMRALLIFAGISLIHQFEFLTYILGVFLIFTGVKTALSNDERFSPERNPVIRLLRKIIPVTDNYVAGNFFVRQDGKWLATPLFVVLAIIEFTDVVFALDSIPAILAITTDPFIVYTSNVFAILGLRSMFFALSGVMDLFHYLQYGVSLVLVMVGAKMLLANWIEIREIYLLAAIVLTLGASVLISLVHIRKS